MCIPLEADLRIPKSKNPVFAFCVTCAEGEQQNDNIFLAVAGVVVHYCKCVVLNGGLKTEYDICEPNYESTNRI